MRRAGVVVLAAAAGLALAGCPGLVTGRQSTYATLTRSGTVGQTLSIPGAVAVTLLRYTPPGTVRVQECSSSQSLPRITRRSYSLALRGGGLVAPRPGGLARLPSGVGCVTGALAFRLPAGRTPSALRFRLRTKTPRPDQHSSYVTFALTWSL